MHLLFFSPHWPNVLSLSLSLSLSPRSVVVVFHYTWPSVHGEEDEDEDGEDEGKRGRRKKEEDSCIFSILWWRVFHQRISMAGQVWSKHPHHQASTSADQAERMRPIGRISSFPSPLVLFCSCNSCSLPLAVAQKEQEGEGENRQRQKCVIQEPFLFSLFSMQGVCCSLLLRILSLSLSLSL